MHQNDPDTQRPEQGDIQQQRREVLVGDDAAINRQNEDLLAELRNVLQDATQIREFHVLPGTVKAMSESPAGHGAMSMRRPRRVITVNLPRRRRSGGARRPSRYSLIGTSTCLTPRSGDR